MFRSIARRAPSRPPPRAEAGLEARQQRPDPRGVEGARGERGRDRPRVGGGCDVGSGIRRRTGVSRPQRLGLGPQRAEAAAQVVPLARGRGDAGDIGLGPAERGGAGLGPAGEADPGGGTPPGRPGRGQPIEPGREVGDGIARFGLRREEIPAGTPILGAAVARIAQGGEAGAGAGCGLGQGRGEGGGLVPAPALRRLPRRAARRVGGGERGDEVGRRQRVAVERAGGGVEPRRQGALAGAGSASIPAVSASSLTRVAVAAVAIAAAPRRAASKPSTMASSTAAGVTAALRSAASSRPRARNGTETVGRRIEAPSSIAAASASRAWPNT